MQLKSNLLKLLSQKLNTEVEFGSYGWKHNSITELIKEYFVIPKIAITDIN